MSRSAHTRLIDKPINDALPLVTGCVRTTTTDNLLVLSGITPTELRRKRATLSLACRVQEPGHLVHDRLTSHPYEGYRQLNSRHPFVPAALELLRDASELEPVQQDGRTTGGALIGGRALLVYIHFWWCGRFSTRDGASQTRLGPAEPSPNWSWPLLFINAQMRHGFHSVLWAWCRGTDRRPYYNILSLMSPSKWDSESAHCERELGKVAVWHVLSHLEWYYFPMQRRTHTKKKKRELNALARTVHFFGVLGLL